MKQLTAILLSAVILLFILSGCNMPQRADTPPTETLPEIREETPEPTEEPTPVPPREKIVFIPSDEASAVTAQLSAALESVCGDQYECVTAVSEDEITDDTNFAVFAKEPTAVSALTQRFPNTRLILAAAPGSSYVNAWTIQYDESFLPFLAGMAIESVSTDWRSVGLIPNDSQVWGSHAEEAFLNGGHYLCGNCMSVMAPYVGFPLTVSLPGNSAPESWTAQLDDANRSIIYSVFLSDEAVSETVIQKLVSLNVQVLTVSGLPAGLESHWVGSVSLDWAETLRQIMARSDAGEYQGSMGVVLSVTPGYLRESFSEGKAAMLRQAYADLLSGKLSAYTPDKEYTE